ncbi:hypothetical protein POX_d05663 [Penicillium oxalicum]|uniref:hypothetical protein n=1 Tax=Penicillium oxalicum TaxID=69781 RepID=UPI0020B74577|nr:hypothetical protein POX_d05663 [Penicillium oxalicum]KAI2790157.1 hypothetical protein POX_d05663 [Penicillium oxalicum]
MCEVSRTWTQNACKFLAILWWARGADVDDLDGPGSVISVVGGGFSKVAAICWFFWFICNLGSGMEVPTFSSPPWLNSLGDAPPSHGLSRTWAHGTNVYLGRLHLKSWGVRDNSTTGLPLWLWALDLDESVGVVVDAMVPIPWPDHVRSSSVSFKACSSPRDGDEASSYGAVKQGHSMKKTHLHDPLCPVSMLLRVETWRLCCVASTGRGIRPCNMTLGVISGYERLPQGEPQKRIQPSDFWRGRLDWATLSTVCILAAALHSTPSGPSLWSVK